MTAEIATLGQRLDGQARRIAMRTAAVRPWAAPFGVLVGHLSALPSPDGGRFARQEVAVAEPPWPAPAPAEPPGRALPSDVLTRLRAVVGPGAEAMRVHDDEAAHETAVAHRADAVTIGSDVYFREGKLDPRQPRGFGLLVHEATHVVEQSRPGASWRRATSGAVAAEEGLALARETAAVSGWTAPVSGPIPQMSARSFPGAGAPGHSPMTAASFPVPVAAPPSGPVATPAARPMTASIDRPPGPPPTTTEQPFDVEALRERLVRDLMRQLRDEFERGG